jgi:hypothetical protein
LIETKSGARFEWQQRPQIMPLAEKAKLYFELPDYADICSRRKDELAFAVDRPTFEAKMPALKDFEW